MAEIRETRFLPLGKKLTLTSDAFTTGHFFQQKPGAEPSSLTSITASTAAVIESANTVRCFVFVTNAALTFLEEFAIASDGAGLNNIVEDVTPQLGGDLDRNGNLIDGRVPSTDGDKLDLIEAKADVTDAVNVIGSIDGASIPTATVAGTDKVIIQDTNDADNTKTVNAQAVADLFVPTHTASSADTLTNKTFDANGTGNSLSNVDVADLANGTDGELITWDAAGAPATVSVGTSTHVLTSNGPGTAPTFQVAGGGGSAGVTLLSSVTASAASTVDFDNFLDDTYEVYFVTFSSVVFSLNANSLEVRMGTGATPTYQSGGTDYRWANFSSSITTSNSNADAADTSIVFSSVGTTVGNATGEELVGKIYIHSPDDASTPTYLHGEFSHMSSANRMVIGHTGGRFNQNTAATSIQLFPVAGTISGEFKLYGIIKS